ncbi:DMT family transporter [Alteromonas facilis]|uniref:DMT family transporter n=1 Tax=Alteromonas facilis TaxID=2048004 RepID=UPI001F0C07FC|nr:DMT family transporter [Alteromonas facilis]
MSAVQQQVYRPGLGFFLAFITAVLWGILPVFLKLCLMVMDSATITAYRFYSAGLVVFGMLLLRRQMPTRHSLSRNGWVLLSAATVLLVLNYVTNVQGLLFLNPESAQVLMQIAPFMLMLGGVFFYKEVFTRQQVTGAVVLLLGLVLFFNQRLPQILSSTHESPYGLFLIIIAAVCWAAYALLQKPLLSSITARQLTFFIYMLGGTMLLPFTTPMSIFEMDTVQLWSLVFCCANTLIAYGAFTYAMGIWEASKVSAVIAIAPLFTLISSEIAIDVWPSVFVSSELDTVAYIGACCVVLGSMLASLGRKRSAN